MDTFTFPNYIGTTETLVRTITDELGRRWPVPAGGSEDEGDREPADDTGDEGETSPLEQQALDAIEQLKSAGQEIPDALEGAVNEFRKARAEAKQYRTERDEVGERLETLESTIGSIAKALNPDADADDTPDLDTLQAEISERDDALRTKTIELDVYRRAGEHEADADALLDSRSFIQKAAQLDPSADDYTDQLDAAVAEAVEDNPKLRAGQTPPPGAADQGPRGRADNGRAATLEEAVARRLEKTSA